MPCLTISDKGQGGLGDLRQSLMDDGVQMCGPELFALIAWNALYLLLVLGSV